MTDGGGHKAALPDMEEELVDWTGLRVTRSNVTLELAQAKGTIIVAT